MSRAVDGAIRVGRSAAEQTTILWKRFGYHQGADLLLKNKKQHQYKVKDHTDDNDMKTNN